MLIKILMKLTMITIIHKTKMMIRQKISSLKRLSMNKMKLKSSQTQMKLLLQLMMITLQVMVKLMLMINQNTTKIQMIKKMKRTKLLKKKKTLLPQVILQIVVLQPIAHHLQIMKQLILTTLLTKLLSLQIAQLVLTPLTQVTQQLLIMMKRIIK